MKKTYLPPRLTTHGSVSEITAFFGPKVQGDVIRDANDQVVVVGLGSRNGCEEQNNVCL